MKPKGTLDHFPSCSQKAQQSEGWVTTGDNPCLGNSTDEPIQTMFEEYFSHILLTESIWKSACLLYMKTGTCIYLPQILFCLITSLRVL